MAVATRTRRPQRPASDPLGAWLEGLRQLGQRANDDPLRWVRWTPPQDQFLRLAAPRKLFRAGNQAIGKTWAALAEVVYRCTGRHPYLRVRPAPIEAWIICTTRDQSVAVQRKFHALCPAAYIDERRSSNYSHEKGYGRNNPVVVFRCGSIVRFRTTRQGAAAQASASVDVILIDEPTTYEVYREADRRVMRRGGVVLIDLTPINLDCGWVQDLVDRGSLTEIHARLTVENLTPLGASEPLRLEDGTLMDQAWIDLQRRTVLPSVAPVILDGEWDGSPEGTIFGGLWDPKIHVVQHRLNPERGEILWCLGLDHSATNREFGQVAILCQVQRATDEKGRLDEAIIAADEVVLNGIADNRRFARAILDMLDRRGLEWRHLHSVYGDNPAESRHAVKSNVEVLRAIARELDRDHVAVKPRVLNAKDGPTAASAVDAGYRYLYERMASGKFHVHERCVRLAEAFGECTHDRHHPAKDRLDGTRYALKEFVTPRVAHSRSVVRFR